MQSIHLHERQLGLLPTERRTEHLLRACFYIRKNKRVFLPFVVVLFPSATQPLSTEGQECCLKNFKLFWWRVIITVIILRYVSVLLLKLYCKLLEIENVGQWEKFEQPFWRRGATRCISAFTIDYLLIHLCFNTIFWFVLWAPSPIMMFSI